MRACPACGSVSEGRPFLSARDWLSPALDRFALVSCPGCGLVSVSPQPADMRRFYVSGYYTHRHPASAPGPRPVARPSPGPLWRSLVAGELYPRGGEPRPLLGRLLVALFRRRLHARARWGLVGESGVLLDVGCGNGEYLSWLGGDWLLAGRFSGCGVDVDPSAVALAGQAGLRAAVADAARLPFPGGSFDFVMMRHSLEHQAAPDEALREVHRVLRPGGRLLVEVPNVDSAGFRWLKDRWSGVDAPRHLHLFTPRTLATLLGRCGFEVTGRRLWPGTYKRDLSLRNAMADWDRRHVSRAGREVVRRAFAAALRLADLVSRGGALSMKGRKAPWPREG